MVIYIEEGNSKYLFVPTDTHIDCKVCDLGKLDICEDVAVCSSLSEIVDSEDGYLKEVV